MTTVWTYKDQYDGQTRKTWGAADATWGDALISWGGAETTVWTNRALES